MPESGIDINRLLLDANLSISVRVCFLVMCIVSITQLAVGAVYKNDCPQQPYIPIYLMVMGIITLLSLFSTVACNASSGSLHKVCSCLSGLVSLFFCCWFIAGNVWIYSIYEPNYDKTTTDVEAYCDKTVYQLAFWTTNLIYILLGFLSCIVFCFFCLFSA
ncbi:transmembrane protein 272-like isoform X2 [Thunnus thynnus]|uniref:transmembrane protein 272-like isoform X2 n=1 Tax=Thunnus thynnus TaxID=8237 RepID=UPI0035275862